MAQDLNRIDLVALLFPTLAPKGQRAAPRPSVERLTEDTQGRIAGQITDLPDSEVRIRQKSGSRFQSAAGDVGLRSLADVGMEVDDDGVVSDPTSSLELIDVQIGLEEMLLEVFEHHAQLAGR